MTAYRARMQANDVIEMLQRRVVFDVPWDVFEIIGMMWCLYGMHLHEQVCYLRSWSMSFVRLDA